MYYTDEDYAAQKPFQPQKSAAPAHAGSWFVRKWYRTGRVGYCGGPRDVNIKYATEAEARAAFLAPYEKGQIEATLFQGRADGSACDRVEHSKRAKK